MNVETTLPRFLSWATPRGRAAVGLADVDGGTEVVGEHDDLPPGLSAADNEAGWRESLAKLAALVEADQ